jgi:hypothetical protein
MESKIETRTTNEGTATVINANSINIGGKVIFKTIPKHFIGELKYVLYSYICSLNTKEMIIFKCGNYAFNKICNMKEYSANNKYSGVLNLSGEYLQIVNDQEIDKKLLIITLKEYTETDLERLYEKLEHTNETMRLVNDSLSIVVLTDTRTDYDNQKIELHKNDLIKQKTELHKKVNNMMEEIEQMKKYIEQTKDIEDIELYFA